MNILVLNCGSATVKFRLVTVSGAYDDLHGQRRLASGLVDRIGEHATCDFSTADGNSHRGEGDVEDHEGAVRRIIDWLDDQQTISGIKVADIHAVGHRVVHGGDTFTSPVLIDDGVIARIDALSELAPLHNPPAVSGMVAVKKILPPSLPMVAVFDTSFHHTIPPRASVYAIPYELTSKYQIRRYGFHGLAHQYSLWRYAEITKQTIEQSHIITLHLGNGCSACAIRAGQSMDTSMGFTPLEGLVMGTRSGDLDPALLNYLARKEKITATEAEQCLNERSGLRGLSGLSNDMREITATYRENPRSRLALEVFCYRARKYLGAYLAVLGGAQAVVFSGGIGENVPLIRQRICEDMAWCGLTLDATLNAAVIGIDGAIAAPSSSLKAYVIHTDEEALIARETAALVHRWKESANGNQV